MRSNKPDLKKSLRHWAGLIVASDAAKAVAAAEAKRAELQAQAKPTRAKRKVISAVEAPKVEVSQPRRPTRLQLFAQQRRSQRHAHRVTLRKG